MPVVRYRLPDINEPRLGWLEEDRVLPFPEGYRTPQEFLQHRSTEITATVRAVRSSAREPIPAADLVLLAPIDAQEVWAAGVTYRRSRDARMEESTEESVYDRIYDADRPEIFLKGTPRRIVGPNGTITIRSDSGWDVPEPELTLVINRHAEVIGYTIGNDVSSRAIEGDNPLYLPQAKIYTGSGALGPVIALCDEIADPGALDIALQIERGDTCVYEGATSTAEMHRSLDDLVSWLHRGNTFPDGVFLMTGTGIVPPEEFTLEKGDIVRITIAGLGTLSNRVSVLDVGA